MHASKLHSAERAQYFRSNKCTVRAHVWEESSSFDYCVLHTQNKDTLFEKIQGVSTANGDIQPLYLNKKTFNKKSSFRNEMRVKQAEYYFPEQYRLLTRARNYTFLTLKRPLDDQYY